MGGLDCTLEGRSFVEVASVGYNRKFPFELVRISIVPLTLALDAVELSDRAFGFNF